MEGSRRGTGGTWSEFRNLLLDGGYTSGAEAERHGINSSDRILVTRCNFMNWAGDGVHVSADSPTGNANSGGNSAKRMSSIALSMSYLTRRHWITFSVESQIT